LPAINENKQEEQERELRVIQQILAAGNSKSVAPQSKKLAP